MYSIPSDFDLDQFKGAIVQQICFAQNVISLMLGASTYISFEGEFILTTENSKTNNHKVYPVVNDYGLLQLIKQEIKEISVKNSNSDLLILFGNNSSLTIIASKQYESYSIKTKDDFIRV